MNAYANELDRVLVGRYGLTDAEKVARIIEARVRDLGNMPKRMREAGLTGEGSRGYPWQFSAKDVIALAAARVSPEMAAAYRFGVDEWVTIRRLDRKFSHIGEYATSRAAHRRLVAGFYATRHLADAGVLLDAAGCDTEALLLAALAGMSSVEVALDVWREVEDHTWLAVRVSNAVPLDDLLVEWERHVATFATCRSCLGKLGYPDDHVCGYDAELGDSDFMCNCCDACESACMANI